MADRGKRPRSPNTFNQDEYPSGGVEIDDNIIETILKSLAARRSQTSPEDFSLSTTYFEVKPVPQETVLNQIASLSAKVIKDIMAKTGVSISLPSRSRSNQIFDPELGRNVLGDRKFERRLAGRSKFKTSVMFYVLRTIWGAVKDNISVTKRGVFYSNVELYKEQQVSDEVLDDVCCLLMATRSSLKVISAEGKGFVVGNIEFTDDGDPIDCTKMGIGGKSIPPNIDRVGEMSSNALFILLVEKQSTFIRLAEERYYRRFPCIIVCAQGQPDLGTRQFVSMIDKKFKLPIFGLFDCDPYGLRILSVYHCGSLSMSYDSSNLATPGINWLGLTPYDLETYEIPKECLLPMSEEDMKAGDKLMHEGFLKNMPEWRKALEMMLNTGRKAELQALNVFGLKYLTETYLPSKLQRMDWI